MPSGNKQFIDSNVNYLGKDFSDLKDRLITYAKTYFPNSYKDFNETSSGMMLIEMSAYVGDVLSFYIDQQYREMMLSLAEERRNVVNMAKMFGYKTKPSIPAYVDLTFKQTVNATSVAEGLKPSFIEGLILNSGIKVYSDSNTNLVFETLGVVDFQSSGSGICVGDACTAVPTSFDVDTNVVTKYTLSRIVRAISAETKIKSFNIGDPTKFLKLTLSDTNVVEVIEVTDSSNNKWYEVDYLAQDKVPVDKHYTMDSSRDTAYSSLDSNGDVATIPIPYTLEYIYTQKRFTVEVDENNKTSLVFGNGIIRSGQNNLQTALYNSEQVGIIIPGQSQNLQGSLNPLNIDDYGSLGETPTQTTINVKYRVGGGIISNVSSGDLSSYDTLLLAPGSPSLAGGLSITVNNIEPAVGGSDYETLDEIKENVKANFATQNRCVTKEDYEARIKSMPAEYGGVAKVFVERAAVYDSQASGIDSVFPTEATALVSTIFKATADLIDTVIENDQTGINLNVSTGDYSLHGFGFDANSDTVIDALDADFLRNYVAGGIQQQLGTIKVYILGYNDKKELLGNPLKDSVYEDGSVTGDKLPVLMYQNIKNYINQYRILTDQIALYDGFIINFGVFFDVVAHKNAIKPEVKLKCIEKIRKHFRTDNMKFREPIYSSDVEYELMSVDGVRAVNYVTITQTKDWNQTGNPDITSFGSGLYDNIITDGAALGGQGTAGYGYQYDFNQFYNVNVNHPLGIEYHGIILPSSQPSVFELKNPNKNIIGVVR